jgi:hypothetical protein
MQLNDVPVLGMLVEWGADDRVFDALLLLGPLLVVVIAVVGRHSLLVAVSSIYVLVFLLRVAANGLRSAMTN